MDKKLFDAICEFCEYLTDWDEKKQDYIDNILPDLKYGYSPKEIKSEARIIFNEKIRTLTNPYPAVWENIVDVIARIKEDPKEYLRTIINKGYRKIFDYLNETYNFQGFIHTTSFDNFINIMKSGYIYSRNYIHENNINTSEIALDGAIDITSDKIKNYVRLYWRVKTPTNYRNEGIKPKSALTDIFRAHSPNPVIFIFDEMIALNENVRFTPKNACKCSNLFEHTFCEDCIKYPFRYNFKNIFHDRPIMEYEDKQIIIDARQAELLYPEHLPIKNIKKIIFRSKADYDRAVLELGNNNKFEVDTQQFCNNWLQIKDYQVEASDSNIYLRIAYYYGKCFQSMYNLLDFTHRVSFLDNNLNAIEEIEINNLIEIPYSEVHQFCFKNKSEYKYICYYIDNIECIRTKIND